MKKRVILLSNKKSFTLIELLIAVGLLVLIFTFLYTQFNLTYLSTDKTTQIEQQSSKRELFLKLFYEDIIKATQVTPTNFAKYDILDLQTSNSLYGISDVFVKYVVVQDNEIKKLVRIESHDKIMIQNRTNNFYMDTILENIHEFEVLTDGAYVEFFIQYEDINNVHFKFKRLM